EVDEIRADTAKKQAEIDKTLAEIGKVKAESIERLARADTYDLQIGQITDPQLTGAGAGAQIDRPAAAQPNGATPSPERMPTPPQPDPMMDLPEQAYEFAPPDQGQPMPQPPVQPQFIPPQQAGF